MGMDGGDGCTTMWMYLMPLTVHFKMVKMVNFMRIFPQEKKAFKKKKSENHWIGHFKNHIRLCEFLNEKILFWKRQIKKKQNF